VRHGALVSPDPEGFRPDLRLMSNSITHLKRRSAYGFVLSINFSSDWEFSIASYSFTESVFRRKCSASCQNKRRREYIMVLHEAVQRSVADRFTIKPQFSKVRS